MNFILGCMLSVYSVEVTVFIYLFVIFGSDLLFSIKCYFKMGPDLPSRSNMS